MQKALQVAGITSNGKSYGFTDFPKDEREFY